MWRSTSCHKLVRYLSLDLDSEAGPEFPTQAIFIFIFFLASSTNLFLPSKQLFIFAHLLKLLSFYDLDGTRVMDYQFLILSSYSIMLCYYQVSCALLRLPDALCYEEGKIEQSKSYNTMGIKSLELH
ncbi:hypothetical protein F4815DRAFT_469057 [Daldinia loculata]|nr:hypothetical protein F4815DRAFT_469057 [Daldinia loculata]